MSFGIIDNEERATDYCYVATQRGLLWHHRKETTENMEQPKEFSCMRR